MEDFDDRVFLAKEADDDEEEWEEEDEEVIEEDEEIVEEDEEVVEEDEEEVKPAEKKPEAKQQNPDPKQPKPEVSQQKKEEKPVEKPQKPEEKPKDEKKPPEPPPKAAEKPEPKKPAEPKPEKKPKTPEEWLRTGKILFIAGLCVFFLATCAERSHLHSIASAQYKVFKYSHKSDEPIKPVGVFRKSSTKLDDKERAEENKTFAEEYKKADEEFEKGKEVQEYVVAVEEWKKDKHDDAISLQKAQIAVEKACMNAGSWACLRYYASQIGILLMILGLAIILLHGSPFEKAASLVLIWVGAISAMNGGLLTGGSAIQTILNMMK